MILSEVSIKRPVFAVMMVAALLVLGVTSFYALSVDLFPKIDFPFVVVTVVYPGASALNSQLSAGGGASPCRSARFVPRLPARVAPVVGARRHR